MPHHEHIHHQLPNHTNRPKSIFFSFLISSLFAITFALALRFFGISINVIIPSTAPVWMGALTIGYMVQAEK